MIKNTVISEIMTENPITLESNDLLWEAEKMFKNHYLRHAPVIRAGELVGMISKDDFKRITPSSAWKMRSDSREENSYPNQYVYELMTHDPVAVQVDTSIKEVAEILMEKEFHGDRI